MIVSHGTYAPDAGDLTDPSGRIQISWPLVLSSNPLPTPFLKIQCHSVSAARCDIQMVTIMPKAL